MAGELDDVVSPGAGGTGLSVQTATVGYKAALSTADQVTFKMIVCRYCRAEWLPGAAAFHLAGCQNAAIER